jgi:hypothetical protein
VPHQRARDALRATLPAPCGYGCGRLLLPTGDWVAAHRVDGNAAAGYLASCRTCNERAKGSGGTYRPPASKTSQLCESQGTRADIRRHAPPFLESLFRVTDD